MLLRPSSATTGPLQGCKGMVLVQPKGKNMLHVHIRDVKTRARERKPVPNPK